MKTYSHTANQEMTKTLLFWNKNFNSQCRNKQDWILMLKTLNETIKSYSRDLNLKSPLSSCRKPIDSKRLKMLKINTKGNTRKRLNMKAKWILINRGSGKTRSCSSRVSSHFCKSRWKRIRGCTRHWCQPLTRKEVRRKARTVTS